MGVAEGKKAVREQVQGQNWRWLWTPAEEILKS